MTAIAQLRLVAPAETRAPVVPEAQIINLTIENDEKLLLTVVEAAHRLGIGRTLMYELLASGRIESVHVGRLHKVPVGALAAFVRRQPANQSAVKRLGPLIVMVDGLLKLLEGIAHHFIGQGLDRHGACLSEPVAHPPLVTATC